MHKVLFVTQTLGERAACGIGLIGKLIGESLVKSQKYDFEIVYTDSENELRGIILTAQPRAIIYNYYSYTTPWVNSPNIRNEFQNICHIMLHHDMNQHAIDSYQPSTYHGFKYLIAPDPTLKGNKHIYIVNRLIPPYDPKPILHAAVPTIGFQGFGLSHKGIQRIAEKVNEEFDEAIIRLHIPYSFFVDPNGHHAKKRIEEVLNVIKKPGIRVDVSHDLLSTKEIIEFLGQNTINCYFYDYMEGAGLASSTDYALAAKRPIAVTKSHQLRNFIGLTPSICIEDNSLKDIISFGLNPLKQLHHSYAEASVLREYEKILDDVLHLRNRLRIRLKNCWASISKL